MSNKAAVIDYFTLQKPEPPTYTGLFIVGLITLVVGLLFTLVFRDMILFGIIAVPFSFIFFHFWRKPYLDAMARYNARPTDDQMDSWLAEDLNRSVKKFAFEKFNIDPNKVEEDKYMIVPTPIYWKLGGISDGNMLRRMGRDGRYRYSVWNVEVFLMTKNYMSAFECVYDWLSDRRMYEGTNEFFYTDMASIKTMAEPIDRVLFGTENQKVGDANKFKVINVSGDVMDITTEIPSLSAPQKLVMKVDKVVQMLRMMLRNRRIEEDLTYGSGKTDLKSDKNLNKSDENKSGSKMDEGQTTEHH